MNGGHFKLGLFVTIGVVLLALIARYDQILVRNLFL